MSLYLTASISIGKISIKGERLQGSIKERLMQVQGNEKAVESCEHAAKMHMRTRNKIKSIEAKQEAR